MAKEILVSESLTNEMISVGEELLFELEEGDTEISAAYWFFFPEERVWKLFFASKLVGSEGPKKYYKKIVDVLANFVEKELTISLNNIGVADNSDKTVLLLSSVFSTEKSNVNVRISRETINGQFIDDAYVYKAAST